MIANLKREILKLGRLLDAQREESIEALRERAALDSVMKLERDRVLQRDAVYKETSVTMDHLAETHRVTLYELRLCTQQLENTREDLRDACEEQEALRVKLSQQAANIVNDSRIVVTSDMTTQDSHPHLDWVGRHYLGYHSRKIECSNPVSPSLQLGCYRSCLRCGWLIDSQWASVCC